MATYVSQAVAQRKAPEAKLGNPTSLGGAQSKGTAANRATADDFAANVLPIIHQIEMAGATTHRAIAAALNARGIRTARGGAWHDSTVRNLLARELPG
jgi:hypothetical protein